MLKDLTELEAEYVDARVEHSVTAKRCWKLRAALDRAGLTTVRENQLNEEFAEQIRMTVES